MAMSLEQLAETERVLCRARESLSHALQWTARIEPADGGNDPTVLHNVAEARDALYIAADYLGAALQRVRTQKTSAVLEPREKETK
jgi:hypothetical protein